MCILPYPLQLHYRLDYPGVQVGTGVHVSDLAYTDDIVILSRRCKAYWKQLIVGMRIGALKTNEMSARIPDEQRQAVLLKGDKFKHLDTELGETSAVD